MDESSAETSAAGIKKIIADKIKKKISELPVVDAAGHPLGLIDITDIVATSGPRETRNAAASGPTVLKLVNAPRRKPKKT